MKRGNAGDTAKRKRKKNPDSSSSKKTKKRRKTMRMLDELNGDSTEWRFI
jgi:hypothetical protein